MSSSNTQKTEATLSTKTRNKVQCDCSKCNGRLVDPRTRKKHEEEENQMKIRYSSAKIGKSSPKKKRIDDDEENLNTSKSSINLESENASNSSVSTETSEETEQEQHSSNVLFRSDQSIGVTTKRKRREKFQTLEPVVSEQSDDPDDHISDDERTEISEGSGDDEENISQDERFTAPEFGSDGVFKYPDSDIKFSESWILIWIFKYQARFRLPDTAINSLIGFLGQLLKDVDARRFHDFPSSSYKAKQLLQIDKGDNTYVACPKCNKLYNSEDLPLECKCNFVEFPNHPMRKHRESCGTELMKNIPIANGYTQHPQMVFPMPDLKSQILAMYQRPDFEQNMTKWAHRHVDENMLADIYDGKIWKTFQSEDSDPFFTQETADSHLGLMINLDWFQPFESSVYSTGVIYGVICNLPREIWF